MWSHIKPYLQAASDDPTRFAGVQELGVDAHVWHQDQRRRGPRELTGIVDLTHGRSGTIYKKWLAKRGKTSRSNIQIAFLERFQGQQERHRWQTPGGNPTNYRLRILLITAGLDASTHTHL